MAEKKQMSREDKEKLEKELDYLITVRNNSMRQEKK